MRLLATARDANHYHISRDGQLIATLRLSVGRPARIDLADGGSLLLRREATPRTRYIISHDTPAAPDEQPAGPLLRATRPNPLRRSYAVTIGNRQCALRAASPWRGDYLFLEGAAFGGAAAGAIRHTATRSRDAIATLPDSLPQETAIALFCLVLAIWRYGHARVDTL
jgi:hypothetical protein